MPQCLQPCHGSERRDRVGYGAADACAAKVPAKQCKHLSRPTAQPPAPQATNTTPAKVTFLLRVASSTSFRKYRRSMQHAAAMYYAHIPSKVMNAEIEFVMEPLILVP